MNDRPTRVLIVDDHQVFLDGMAALMELEEDLTVVGKARGVPEAKTMASERGPDVIVLDLTLDGDSGFDFIRWMRDRELIIPVMVASMHEDEVYVERAMSTGARGYVTKRSSSDVIFEGIRRTRAGEVFVDAALAAPVASNATEDPVRALSPKEFDVFELVGRGLGTAEIAAKLHRSVKTIESHRLAIKKKLDIASAHELVRYATLWVQRH